MLTEYDCYLEAKSTNPDRLWNKIDKNLEKTIDFLEKYFVTTAANWSSVDLKCSMTAKLDLISNNWVVRVTSRWVYIEYEIENEIDEPLPFDPEEFDNEANAEQPLLKNIVTMLWS